MTHRSSRGRQIGRIVDNTAARRFEMDVDGQLAFVDYQVAGRLIILTHAEVPAESRGRGIGSALALGVLDTVRARGLAVVPACPFIASFIQTHPEYQDLLLSTEEQ